MVYCYFNGEVIEESKASLPINTLGVQRGFGIFDLFRGRNGKPTFMEDHLDRFDRSQQFLQLDRLITKDEIRNAVSDLQSKNGFGESAFKLMLLGAGSETELVLQPLFYIINIDLSDFQNADTANLILHEYVREYPQIKTTNYLTSNVLHRKRMQAEAIDVLYHHNGLISEASRSNVYVVKDGVIRTPKDHVLEGITRKQLLRLSDKIEVANITVDELEQADEVFISSTLKEIMPITSIDGKKVGDGRTGPLTKQVRELFFDHLHQ